jgi:hypothetical protein
MTTLEASSYRDLGPVLSPEPDTLAKIEAHVRDAARRGATGSSPHPMRAIDRTATSNSRRKRDTAMKSLQIEVSATAARGAAVDEISSDADCGGPAPGRGRSTLVTHTPAIDHDDMATEPRPSIPLPVIVVGAGLAATAAWRRGRRRRAGRDPVHAPGHRHRWPAPSTADPALQDVAGTRDQPWVRTSHSDSQQRRFRR